MMNWRHEKWDEGWGEEQDEVVKKHLAMISEMKSEMENDEWDLFISLFITLPFTSSSHSLSHSSSFISLFISLIAKNYFLISLSHFSSLQFTSSSHFSSLQFTSSSHFSSLQFTSSSNSSWRVRWRVRWRDEELKKMFLVWTYVKPNLVLSQIPFTWGGGGVWVYRQDYIPTSIHTTLRTL